jgi:HD-GYP domain-containing protein (c-di-GMP phosphodiesterase class II)
VSPPNPRLAEPLAALSLAGDLGMGFALEHAIRVTFVAGRLASTLGLGVDERSNIFYVALLHGIGCTADAHDLARVFVADEIALKTAGAVLDDDDRVAGLRFVFTNAGSSGSAAFRPVAILRSLALGQATFRDGLRAHCEVGDLLASGVGVPAVSRDGLLALFDRWDGKGIGRVGGADLPLAARVFHVAKTATAHFDHAGSEAAIAAVRAQAGRALEPALSDAFLDLAIREPIWSAFTEPDLWDRTLDLEPAEQRLYLDANRHAALFEAIADVADLKSPAFVGHSRGVSALAVAAGRRLGLSAPELEQLGRAALAHDLGRISVPNTILDKPRPLTPAEWEVVRLHAYHTERILLRSVVLAPCAATAGLHHERLDGSGYHRGVRAPSIPSSARLLSAADVYQALTCARPYRRAVEPQRAATALRAEAGAGRLDAGAVEAVIATAHGLPLRLMGGGRLSEREVEVLRLLAGGLSTREVADRLAITEKTVRHHVEHIYDKLGVSTRAAAVVAAIGEGRLGDVGSLVRSTATRGGPGV